MIFIAILAIILPLILLAILNMPALKGMAISAIVVTLAGLLIWHMPPMAILSSIFQGIHKTLPILWILFGALMMLEILNYTGAISRINIGFKQLTPDMRLLSVLIAYLFGGLIEGVSGFGTPAMVTAPLLIALGFTPMAAVTLALVADSNPASFGAVGTPVTVGLSNVATHEPAAFLNQVGIKITQLDLFSGLFMPLLLILVLVIFFNDSKTTKRDWLDITPWALFIGAIYTGSALFYAYFVSYEFITILASLTALLLAVLTIKYHILLPKKTIQNPWTGAKQPLDPKRQAIALSRDTNHSMSLLTAWAPYIVVISLLLISRIFPTITNWLNSAIDLGWKHILSFSTINSDWAFLYSPGTILFISSLVALIIQAHSLRPTLILAKNVIQSMGQTAITLMATLIMVQVFSNSGINTANLTSMPTYIATTLSHSLSGIWVFIAPFLGELGSFITGSATVSTLTFAPIQIDVAHNASLAKELIIALQILGAAAGNMICVHNIVAASAVVGLRGQEGAILRKTVIPALILGLLLGLAAFFIF